MSGGNQNLPAQDQRPLGQFIQRSSTNEMGRVLPLIYGRQRVGCTFISRFFDIVATAVFTGGKQRSYAGSNYYASFAAAVGHGTISNLVGVYLNGTPVFTNNTPLYALTLTQHANVATYTTASPHMLTTGQTVVIFYSFQPEFNGEFTITVTGPNTFTYVIPGSSLPDETATPQLGQNIYALLELDPISSAGEDFTDFTIPDFGEARIYWGTETQATDDYLSRVSGVQHPAYRGVAYIVFHQLFLGFNQTSVQNLEVVVERTPAFDGMTTPAHSSINGSCNPACIVADLYLNPRLGLNADIELDVNIAALDTAAEQFNTEGVGLSPIATRPQDALSIIVASLQNVDAAPTLDSDGKLSIVLKRYNAAPTAINETNLTALPKLSPADWSTVINQTYLTFIDRQAGFQPDFVSWIDNAAVYAKDRPEPQTLDRPMITDRVVAELLAPIIGQVSALPKTTGKLQLVFDVGLFNAMAPGSAINFSYTARPALNGFYRVLSRTIPDPAKPEFEIEIETDRSYLYST